MNPFGQCINIYAVPALCQAVPTVSLDAMVLKADKLLALLQYTFQERNQ